MAIDKTRYPANWNEISVSIRERAGNRCEECGLPNGALIIRSDIDPAYYLQWDSKTQQWLYADGTPEQEPADEYAHGKITKIILSVHHAGVDYADGTPGDPNDKMDNRAENLFALCQRCHFLADGDHNVKARRVTRLVKNHDRIVASGQYELFGENENE